MNRNVYMDKLPSSKFEGTVIQKNKKFVETWFVIKDFCTMLQGEQK